MIRHAATAQNPKLEGGRMIGSAATAQNPTLEGGRIIRSATTTQNPKLKWRPHYQIRNNSTKP